MFVASWSPDFTPDEAPITQAVLPVELRNVPYLLFNEESLCRLATAVGKPVSLYPETQRKENFKVAKLYVRVDLTKPLPRKIISGYSNGKETLIEVNYSWLPLKCELCKKYGHLQEKCKAACPKIDSERKRSVSPGLGRTHQRSPSQEHMMEHNKTLSSSDPEKPSEVEEGEMVEAHHVLVGNSASLEGLEVSVMDATSQAGHTDSMGVEQLRSLVTGSVAGDSGEMVSNAECSEKRLLNQNQNGIGANRSGRSHQSPENHFFLVNNGKSGRKAKKPI